jgi:excisionase family DNA binding protein
MKELTAAQAAETLGVGRSTINLWCRQGRFPGARLEESPLGSYWLIPEKDLNGFEKPERGRPPKPKEEKAVKGSKKKGGKGS